MNNMPQQPDCEQLWNSSSASYKMCCLSSTIIFLFSIFFPALAIFFIDIPLLTVYSFQIWRLFLSFYGQIPNAISLLSVLLSFLWMQSMLKDHEGTVYKIVQVIIINFQIHFVFNFIAFVVTIFTQMEETYIFLGFGWFPIIVVYQFRASRENPQATRNFCCLPISIKNKHFPYIILLLLGLFSSQFLCFLACGIVGYLQQIHYRHLLIQLPSSFFFKLQSCMPRSLISRPDFVKCGFSTNAWLLSEDGNNQVQNSFSRYSPRQMTNMNGRGQPIGGGNQGNQGDYRSFWAQRDQPRNQFQIEPRENGYVPPNNFNQQQQHPSANVY